MGCGSSWASAIWPAGLSKESAGGARPGGGLSVDSTPAPRLYAANLSRRGRNRPLERPTKVPSPAAPAPRPLRTRKAGPLIGRVRVPGDKSISHRALILGALSTGTTRIRGLLEAEDVLNTAKALNALGAPVEKAGDEWIVLGRGVGGLRAAGRAARLRQLGHRRAADDGRARRSRHSRAADGRCLAVQAADGRACSRP